MAGDKISTDLARKLLVGLTGPWPTGEESAWLEQWQPAGVILFSRNVTDFSQLKNLCAELHRLLPEGEIVADHEGGPVSQLAAAVGRPPVARSLGELDDLPLTQAVHRETGRRLAAVGIDRVLAPCCDVLTEPRNPVIGARAFGSETVQVTRQVAAAVTGLLSGGVRTCLKHWPGHGASEQDSHLEAADAPKEVIPKPFLAGLAAGSDAVMVGHLVAVGRDLPATLDPDLLREWRAAFAGESEGRVLFFADDVTMGGLRPAMTRAGVQVPDGRSEGMVEPADLPLLWLGKIAAAGSDRILIRGIPWTALPLDEHGGPLLAAPAQPESHPPVREWGDGPYEESNENLRARFGPGFASRNLRLGWLDLTEGDRWEVAGGDLPGQRQKFADHLEVSFGEVVNLLDCDPSCHPSLDRILVTSHRPISGSNLVDETWFAQLPPQGQVLAMGHPSLAADLHQVLGSGWLVTLCYDVDWNFRLNDLR